MTGEAAQLELSFGPLYVVEVEDRFTAGLTGRQDRTYRSPPQRMEEARTLAALLLDAGETPQGPGPWQRAVAGGRRVVRLEVVPEARLG